MKPKMKTHHFKFYVISPLDEDRINLGSFTSYPNLFCRTWSNEIKSGGKQNE